MIPEAAVEAAVVAFRFADGGPRTRLVAALEAVAPHIAAQVLRDAVEAFPLETITAPDNAVMWLRRRADQIEAN